MANTTTQQRIVFGIGWALNAVIWTGAGALYFVAGHNRSDVWLYGIGVGFIVLAGACAGVSALSIWRTK